MSISFFCIDFNKESVASKELFEFEEQVRGYGGLANGSRQAKDVVLGFAVLVGLEIGLEGLPELQYGYPGCGKG